MIPLMSAMAIGSTVSGLAQLGMGLMDRGRIKRERAEAKKAYEAAKKSYASMDISNPFENVQTEFENPFEDLTVNQQAAQFQRETMRQAQANTLNQLRGAAGGSGVGALAQALANQQTQGAAQIAAGIGKQEQANQLAMAKGGMMEQQLELKGQELFGKGASEQQRLDLSRTSTLLGMDANRLSAANQAFAQNQQMIAGGIGQTIGGLATGFVVGGGFEGATGTKGTKGYIPGGFNFGQFTTGIRS